MSEKKKVSNSKKRSSHSQVKKRRKIFKSIYILFIILILSCFAIGGGIVYGIIQTAPPINTSDFLELEETSTIYDDSGKLIDEFNTPERRLYISFDKVPKYLKDGFVNIEDERFYSHHGIDIKRLAGALLKDIKISLGLSDGSIQGASTITQQLVKYRYFLEDSLENRTSVKRKIQEMYLSMKLEKEISKDQILDSYMNTIFLGGSAHGIEAASQMYFNKSVTDLTLKQCAFLAGAAQNPSVSFYNAYENYKQNTPFNSPRTNAVLEKMLENGAITQEEYNSALEEKLIFDFKLKTSNKMNYEYFSRPVIEQVANDLAKVYNCSKEEAYDKLMYSGFKIHTTMNTNLQNEVQELIDNEVSNSYSNPNLQASAVIMDYKTGDVKCIVGGREDQPANSYNRAASSNFLRSPGSSLKPLTVYAPAIESKTLTAGTAFEDSPIPQDIGSKYSGPGQEPYNPKNSPDIYRGYVTVRDSIRVSANTVAVKITDKIGLNKSVEFGEKFGVQLDKDDKTSMSAMALGQLDGGDLSGTNPLTMATAYGVFGNDGNLTNARLYTKVVDRNNKVILENKTKSTRVLSPEANYIMYDLLKEPIIGTGPSADFGNMPVRGKTGTSSNSVDLWFTGLTPYYSAAVWMGNDDYTPVQGMTSDNPSALWGKIMKVAHQNLEYKDINKPAGITTLDICKDSGTIPSNLSYKDPRGNRVYSELFIEGTEPTAIDDIHVEKSVVKGDDGKYYLPSDKTPKYKIETGVFIRRDYSPFIQLQDSQWVVPTEIDPSNYNPLFNKDKDKNKDKNKHNSPLNDNTKPNNTNPNVNNEDLQNSHENDD